MPESQISRTYQHQAVQLAEGFRSLGIEFFGNHDYWYDHISSDYLIKSNEFTESDVNIFTSCFVNDRKNELGRYINFKKINILIDSEDGYETVGNKFFQYFDVVLKCHMLKTMCYPKNFKPWAFGLTERLIHSVQKFKSATVESITLVNYRVFYDTRYLAKKKLDPLLGSKFPVVNWVTDPYKQHTDKFLKLEAEKKSYWWQTGWRHDEEYFKYLNRCRLTYCFGGPVVRRNNLIKCFQRSEALLRIERRIGRFKVLMGLRRNLINYQFDSWRFWEALISNSIPLHSDFESSGFFLPVNPENGIHYLGVSEFDYQSFWDWLASMDSTALDKISEAGLEFGLAHYGPRAAAKRLLKYLDEL